MRKLFSLAFTAILVTACGDSSGPAEVLPAALTGTWVASSSCSPACSFTLTSVEDPGIHTDLVVTAGLTVDLRLKSDGAATLVFLGESTTGTARLAGANTLILNSGASVDTIDFTVTPTTLDLQFRTLFPIFDFDADGSVDPARAHAVLKKQ